MGRETLLRETERFAALMDAAHAEAVREAMRRSEELRHEAALREEARRRETLSLDHACLRAIEARAIAFVERGEASTNTDAARLALDGAYPPGGLKLAYVEAAVRAATAALAVRANTAALAAQEHDRAQRRAALYASSWSTGGFPPEECRAPQRPQRVTPWAGGHRVLAPPRFE